MTIPTGTPLHPIVNPISSPVDLPRDHHGPFGSPYPYPLSSTTSAGSSTKPRYFRNPWPSYRTASLNDAYLAYQKGAAVAFPPSHHTPGSSRLNLHEFGQGQEQEDEYDGDEREGQGERRAMLSNTSISPPKLQRVYTRPDFAEVLSDDQPDDWREPPCQVVEPTWGDGRDNLERVTWLGHAGVSVQIPWNNKNRGREGTCGVLFDPIFSHRCSPSQYVGPARYLDPPCSVSMLPEVHICCISHDHYDHLDYHTIIDLWKYHQATIHFFVPLGLKQWFVSSGIPSCRITELDWWQESLVSFPSNIDNTITNAHYPPTKSDNAGVETSDGVDLTVKLAFTPAQHRSGRGVFDHMTTLWGSWCLGVVGADDLSKVNERGMKGWKEFTMFFGGDTGYRDATAPEGDSNAICPAFQEIASLYSPFSLSLLPLSTGSSLPFLRTLLSLSLDQYTLTSSLHCSPADSIEIHKILKSERTLGIHWGTFCDSDEARGTRVEFGRCRRNERLGETWLQQHEQEHQEGEEGKEGIFVVADIGETLVFPSRS